MFHERSPARRWPAPVAGCALPLSWCTSRWMPMKPMRVSRTWIDVCAPLSARRPTLRTRHLRRAARLGADCAQLHRAYADDLGIEMNVIGALTDAVALNNGPMRTSV